MTNVYLTGFKTAQNGNEIVTGFIRAEDLIKVYEIDIWEVGKKIEEQGSQRKPIPSHFKKIAKFLKAENSLLPTSIILSYNMDSNPEKEGLKINEVLFKGNVDEDSFVLNDLVQIEIGENAKLRIIDGQHRTLGIKHAIEELNQMHLQDMKLPFVLLLQGSRVQEIKTFYEINSTQKKVSTDLALQLLNDLEENEMLELSKTEVWKLVALNVVMSLNNNKDSVWYRNISVGQNSSSEIASSTSFVTSLKPILDMPFMQKYWDKYRAVSLDPVSQKQSLKDIGEEIAKFVDKYWHAIKLVMPEVFPEDNFEKVGYVIQKTPGFYIWHILAPTIVQELYVKRDKRKSIEVEELADFIRQYADPDKITEAYWQASNASKNIVGGEASKANSQKSFKDLADQIARGFIVNYDEEDQGMYDVDF